MADEFWDDPSWYSSNGYDTNYTSPDDITIDTSFTNPDYSWSNLDLSSLYSDLGLSDLTTSSFSGLGDLSLSSLGSLSLGSLANLNPTLSSITGSSLANMDPDQVTRMYGQQVGDLVAQAQAEDQSLLDQGNALSQFFRSPSISYAPGSLSDRMSNLVNDHRPGQSYVDDNGLVIGTGEGADVQNPYNYLQVGSDTYITGPGESIVGYLDSQGRPTYYSNLAAQSSLDPASSSSGSAGSSGKSALDQIYSKLLAKMNADEAAKKSGLGQALGAAQMAASLYQALAGKNQGYNVQKRSSTVTDSGPSAQAAKPVRTLYAKGGAIDIPEAKHGALVPMAIELAKAMASTGNHGLIPGSHGGQDDVVDIKAAPGEYIFDAETVSALGDGNTEAGAKQLDKMRRNIREHKRGGALTEIAAQAKSPAEYLPKGKK